jgi:hypothetical protein
VLETVRSMPAGVRLFVVYAFIILALIGLALPSIISEAVLTPITGQGLLTMLLLAFTVFTLTLVLQRKRAAYGLALGLGSLTLPLILFFLLWGAPLLALVSVALAVAVFAGLTRPRSRAWFNED